MANTNWALICLYECNGSFGTCSAVHRHLKTKMSTGTTPSCFIIGNHANIGKGRITIFIVPTRLHASLKVSTSEIYPTYSPSLHYASERIQTITFRYVPVWWLPQTSKLQGAAAQEQCGVSLLPCWICQAARLWLFFGFVCRAGQWLSCWGFSRLELAAGIFLACFLSYAIKYKPF